MKDKQRAVNNLCEENIFFGLRIEPLFFLIVYTVLLSKLYTVFTTLVNERNVVISNDISMLLG